MSIDTAANADNASLRQSRRAERLLVPAGFITTSGNTFQITAAAILVFRAGNTTLSVGWLFIAVAIPQVALSVLFGRLADRLDRRVLSMTADLASALTAFALPLWLWLHGSATLGSYLANFLLACSAALFMPASNALVKERIRDDRLDKFNSHFEMANNAGMLLSSSLAGFLVTWFGATPLFVFNSGTFIASAVLTYLIGAKQPKPGAAATTGADTPAAAGGAAIAPTERPIKRLVLLWTSGNANVIVVNTILTVLILHTFHKGPWLIGVTDALAGIGFLTGAACYPWLIARIDGLKLAVAAGLLNCAFLLVESLNYIVLMALIPFAGFVFAQARISSRVLLMRASPEERVGRIFGSGQAFGLALGTAATVGFSALADTTSVRWAFVGLAAMTTTQILIAYLSLIKPMAAPAKPAVALEATTA
ncbi:MAG TPA: MFS transporter [Actinocrinis sp.]|jgi:MFS family permease|uniref:MFS transporter n=1 Tax=Actinocrinis sp. TaxID=1920516 RepID=UPI002DDDA9EC|nr:MFS transporter [Actinocrinis sp.]HEV3171533.1 MFS transporter [Actinocrinis sp.]